jgi:hypothetical protein
MRHGVDSCTTINQCKGNSLRKPLTTGAAGMGILATMKKPPKKSSGQVVQEIYRNRQPNRPHHIEDWAVRRGFSNQAALVKALGADKSLVSKWYSGATPSLDWQNALVELFALEDRQSLFRSPDDDWLTRFFRDRERDEIERIKNTLETAFPRIKKG